MAVSQDGYFARGVDDDMRWTGSTDKAVFKLLTLVCSQGPVLAGRLTAAKLPALSSRTVQPLSRNGLTLLRASVLYPNAWLIGGPTVAYSALVQSLVQLVVLCRVPVTLHSGIHSYPIVSLLPEKPMITIQIGEIEVELFRSPHWR